jgi:hypothetical protein
MHMHPKKGKKLARNRMYTKSFDVRKEHTPISTSGCTSGTPKKQHLKKTKQ